MAGIGSTMQVNINGSSDGNKDVITKAEEHAVTKIREEEKLFNIRGKITDSKGRNFEKLQKRAMFAVNKVGGWWFLFTFWCFDEPSKK